MKADDTSMFVVVIMLMNPLYLSIMSAMLAASLKCWFTESLSVKCLSDHLTLVIMYLIGLR